MGSRLLEVASVCKGRLGLYADYVTADQQNEFDTVLASVILVIYASGAPVNDGNSLLADGTEEDSTGLLAIQSLQAHEYLTQC